MLFFFFLFSCPLLFLLEKHPMPTLKRPSAIFQDGQGAHSSRRTAGRSRGGWILLLTRQTPAGTCPALSGPSEGPGSHNRALEAPGPAVVCRQEGAATTRG